MQPKQDLAWSGMALTEEPNHTDPKSETHSRNDKKKGLKMHGILTSWLACWLVRKTSSRHRMLVQKARVFRYLKRGITDI